jgi:peptidyl-prolyl cis-trans isomerase C
MLSPLKQQCIIAAAALVLAFNTGSSAAEDTKITTPDKVAIVNGVAITIVEFERALANLNRQMAASGKSFQQARLHEVRSRVLESLINNEILYQAAKNQGVRIDEKTIDDQINQWKLKFSNEAEFKEELAKSKTSEKELKLQLRKRYAIKKFVDEEFLNKIEVPEEESKAFYDSNPASFKKPEQVRAQHILILAESNAEKSKKELARKKIMDLKNKIEKGEDFEKLAKAYSQDPGSSVRGGDLGYFSRGKMVKPFEEAAFQIPPGKVSDVIETEYGYHLIKVIDVTPETVITYEQIKGRLQQFLKEQKAQKQIQTYIEKLKSDAKVERYLNDIS